MYRGTGNVGSGVTTPVSKLTLGNNVATGPLNNFSEYQLLLYQGGTGNSSYGLGVRSSTLVYNSGAAHNFDTGGATRMAITSGGNVGIGTTSPTEKLHVEGNLRLANAGGFIRKVRGLDMT